MSTTDPVTLFEGSPLEFLSQGPATIIARIRSGIPVDAVDTLAEELDLSRERFVAMIGLPKSTLKARRAANQPLSLAEGDRMVRVARVLQRAVDVFEDADSARRWITRENRSLGGVTPLSLLDTEAGYELVIDTLGRIEHGIAA